MSYGDVATPSSGTVRRSGVAGGPQTANLADILERVLDKGLVIASLDTARQVGINGWESDPWLNAQAADRAADKSRGQQQLEEENRQLRSRIEALESGERNGGSRGE